MGKKLEKSGWLRSAKHTGSLFRVVKLCLQRNGTGNVPGCTVSLQPFCQEVFVILPMAQDTDTGLTAGCPPPRPPRFAARSVSCQRSQFVLFQVLTLQKRCFFINRDSYGRSSLWGQCSPPLLAGDSPRRAGSIQGCQLQGLWGMMWSL